MQYLEPGVVFSTLPVTKMQRRAWGRWPCVLLILLPSLPGPALEREAAKSTHRWIPQQRQPGFWLLSHLDPEQDQQKDPRGQRCPSSSPNSPSALWVGGNLQTTWCKTSNFPDNSPSYFHLPFHSLPSYKLLPIKKRSTFQPDLKAYPLWLSPTPRGNRIDTWKRFLSFVCNSDVLYFGWLSTPETKNRDGQENSYGSTLHLNKHLAGNPKAHWQESRSTNEPVLTMELYTSEQTTHSWRPLFEENLEGLSESEDTTL